MASEAAIRKLRRLSPQERKVLELRCQGLDYATIAARLQVSDSTIKSYMARTYIKLGMETMRKGIRARVIEDMYCPALRHLMDTEGPLLLGEPESTEAAPEPVLQMVTEDEYPLVPYRPPRTPVVITNPDPKTIIIKEPTPLARRLPWLLTGSMAGVLCSVLTAAGLFAGWWFFLREPPASVAQGPGEPTATAIVQTVVVTAPPEQALSTATPIVVVVTATPLPKTSTSTQPPVPPTETVVPTNTLIPDTLAGTPLKPGDTWTQNGFRLTLVEYELLEFQGEGEIVLLFEMANATGADLTVTLDIQDVVVETNTGTRFRLFNCPDNDKVYQTTLAPATRDAVYLCARNVVLFHGDYFASDVTAVLVTVRNWSRISEAIWQIDINK